ncbi:MAG: 2-C-methyl-D-erythritol 4-phosphate cytidylyltransferase [Verrucomicrobiales bacterium]|nr:2-C-methyl-D-erythritol 4-phosphate cytidylyltransferase [Verrucomicrobiota bacterium JB025]
MPEPDCTAIIVAAGSSRRMGFDKLLWKLADQPVLLRTIHAFDTAPSITSIIVVCPPDRWENLTPPAFSKPVSRTDGGDSRQQSVANGLLAAPTTPLIAVHDGARPLVSPEDIENTIAAARTHRAAALARRAVETVKRSDSRNFATESVSRENLWFMETPQVFQQPILLSACRHVAAANLTVTDEVSALESIGVKTKLVESRSPNLKITSPADLALATALLNPTI